MQCRITSEEDLSPEKTDIRNLGPKAGLSFVIDIDMYVLHYSDTFSC